MDTILCESVNGNNIIIFRSSNDLQDLEKTTE